MRKNIIHGCTFHEKNVNSTFNLGAGCFENDNYHEAIITNGDIKLNDINKNTSFVVFNNNLITLKNGVSLSITISNASFFVLKTFKNGEIDYSIYTENEQEELLDKILKFVYDERYDLFQTESISIPDIKTIIRKKDYDGTFYKEKIDVDSDVKVKGYHGLFFANKKR
jgi:hypothetical protein